MRTDPRQFELGVAPVPLLTLPPLRAAQATAAARAPGATAPLLNGCAAAAVDPFPESSGPEASPPHRSGPGDTEISPALAAVLAERARQIEQFGHTAAADDKRDLYQFSKGAGRLLRRMNETASLHRIDATGKDAVKLAAYALALAESCDRRLAALPVEPPP